MDREQHTTQDAAEHYAVYLMAKTAEQDAVATREHSQLIYQGLLDYLDDRGWTMNDFEHTHFPKYKINVDAQVPKFVKRLALLGLLSIRLTVLFPSFRPLSRSSCGSFQTRSVSVCRGRAGVACGGSSVRSIA